MRRLITCVGAGVVLYIGLVIAQGGGAPAKAKATTPEIPYDSVPNFFRT